MKYILSLFFTLLTLALAQSNHPQMLATSLLFNGTGTNVVNSFQTDSPFVANITPKDQTTLTLFNAKSGQKVMDFIPGQLVPYTGEFFFIVHSPQSNTSWQIELSNQSYTDSLNQARQQAMQAASNNSSTQNSPSQMLERVLSFAGQGNNSTTEFYADRPFTVNFNQDSGIRLSLYSGTNKVASIEPGQTINYTGQFYIYINSPADTTAWKIDLSNVN